MKDGASEEESCLSLNFLLAFLWREWRDSPKTKSFLLARMNSELTELIKSKAVSKVIEQITIDELSLGTSLPIIKGTVHIQTSLYVQYRSLKEGTSYVEKLQDLSKVMALNKGIIIIFSGHGNCSQLLIVLYKGKV